MNDLARFLARPTLRCFAPKDSTGATPCGQPATRFRKGGAWGAHSYLCDRHADAFDPPIPPTVAFRRVRVMGHVDFAGTTWAAGPAQVEAVRCLAAAVEAAGGLLNIMDVSSAIGQHSTDNGVARDNGDKEQG